MTVKIFALIIFIKIQHDPVRTRHFACSKFIIKAEEFFCVLGAKIIGKTPLNDFEQY